MDNSHYSLKFELEKERNILRQLERGSFVEVAKVWLRNVVNYGDYCNSTNLRTLFATVVKDSFLLG